MGKYKGKYKGQRGKVEYIEDIIGTEPLKGTYEARKEMAKKLRQDRELQKIRDQKMDEYYRIREQKERELQQKMVDAQKVIDINRKIGILLYSVLEPDAYQYLNMIRIKDPELCNKICYCLIPPQEMELIDAYCERIFEHGPPKHRIKLDLILKFERAITGVEPKIEVERDGERIELGKAIS